ERCEEEAFDLRCHVSPPEWRTASGHYAASAAVPRLSFGFFATAGLQSPPDPPAPAGASLMKRIVQVAVGILATPTASASGQPPKGRGQAPPIVSPEVKSDRTVTFRLNAPKASEVFLQIEGGGPRKAMTKGENGVWSVTIGPLEPDQYSY